MDAPLMAHRIRTVKPDAWQSEQVCAVSREARLLWVVLITMSDDEGRFRWRPQAVLGHGFPDDEDAAEKLEDWLQELIDEGLVIVYIYARSTFGFHPKWREHQRIDRPRASVLPDPDDDDSRIRRRIDEASTTGRVVDVEPSTEEGKGVGNARGAAGPRSALVLVGHEKEGTAPSSDARPSGSDQSSGAHAAKTPVPRGGSTAAADDDLPGSSA
ncbi:MAG: hypothetical protein REI11_04575 [Patulibacter sp.]|nr:hypothetical protein [Patulibacter sp.]